MSEKTKLNGSPLPKHSVLDTEPPTQPAEQASNSSEPTSPEPQSPALVPTLPILVLLESPFSGDREANVAYARRAMLHSIANGEAPFASHLLYPQVLNDSLESERALGIVLGLVWGLRAAATVVYVDRGISEGMRLGIAAAREAGRPVVYRSLDGANL